jgi:hypothetical protein
MGKSQPEGVRPSEGSFPLEKEYTRAITALERSRILTLLPRSENTGMIGIDGKEYPLPTQEQLQEVFTRNEELVERKMRQGFTQLQLTPIAIPVSQLIERVRTALLERAAAGRIIRTKQDPTDAEIPACVNAGEQVWIWDRVRQALDTPGLVYFPQAYTDSDHQGLTKEEAMQETRLCAVPGWSVGLIEPIPVMPRPGKGRVIGGRKQLEAYSTPRDYLETLSTPVYRGETGWTPEDFLTHFITRLETTGQVSHDRYDGNALWLLGSYMPKAMKKSGLVPVGYWARDAGRKMHMSGHRPGNRLREWVARSMVRLGREGCQY